MNKKRPLIEFLQSIATTSVDLSNLVEKMDDSKFEKINFLTELIQLDNTLGEILETILDLDS